MNLQTSISYQYNERRVLFAHELMFGGHGQLSLSGAGTYVAPENFSFYKIDFLADSVVSDAVFRTVNSDGQVIYTANNDSFDNKAFPKGYSWNAPLTSVTLASGSGIAFMFKLFSNE